MDNLTVYFDNPYSLIGLRPSRPPYPLSIRLYPKNKLPWIESQTYVNVLVAHVGTHNNVVF